LNLLTHLKIGPRLAASLPLSLRCWSPPPSSESQKVDVVNGLSCRTGRARHGSVMTSDGGRPILSRCLRSPMPDLTVAPAITQLRLDCVSETPSSLLTGLLTTVAFIAGWCAHRQQHLGLVRSLLSKHERQSALILSRLADSRRQAASQKNEISMLKREVVQQQARWLRAQAPRVPAMEHAVLRTSVELPPGCPQPEGESGFPDTQPWDPKSS
jgi:hypothetical protein